MKVSRLSKTAVVLVSLLVLMAGFSEALEVKGVNLPDTITIDGVSCKLNGAGIRKKVIINVYAGGLYLEKPAKSESEIISSDQTKRIVLHFLYKEVSAEQLIEAWNEGFEKNTGDKVARLKDKIARFNGFFTEPVKKGEIIVLTYLPGKGTEVVIKGKSMGSIEGKDFMEAVFSIWFGPNPPSKGLKSDMMGE